PPSMEQLHQYKIFLLLLTIFGILISLVSMVSVGAAAKASNALDRRWDEIVAREGWLSYLPRITGGGDPNAHRFGLWLPFFLPILFAVLWASVLLFVSVTP